MKKYIQVASLEWRNALAYRGDVWLGGLFLIFRVILAYLLWRAVFAGRSVIGGMTLPDMVTYYLLGTAIAPLTQNDGLLHDFSREIRTGQYIKYIVRPVSPLLYYMAAGIARSVMPAAASIGILGSTLVLYHPYFASLELHNVLWALLTTVLAMILNMLIGYTISTATFKFTDISGFYIINNITKDFLSGSLVPLHLVFGGTLPVWSPFSYMIYYPVMLCLGKTFIRPEIAISILSLWILVMIPICMLLQRRAPKAFEGVGM